MDPIEKWNNKYRDRLKRIEQPKPNERLQNLSQYLQGGLALDWACGLGTNSLYLAESGYEVDAYDISEVAVGHLKEQAEANQLTVMPHLGDLENWSQFDLKEEAYDLVSITYYLDRSIFPLVKSLVKENGYFFMETFFLSPQKAKQDVSDQYKLRPNELLSEFRDWHILYYEENEQEGRQTIFVRKEGKNV